MPPGSRAPVEPPSQVGFPNMAFATGIPAYPKVVFTGLENTGNLLF